MTTVFSYREDAMVEREIVRGAAAAVRSRWLFKGVEEFSGDQAIRTA
jgi:hypothetical protein